MSSNTNFESRIAKVKYSPEAIYNFVTDVRNFRRFVPQNSISDSDFKQDSCSFNVNMLGKVDVNIRERVMFNKIVFSGNALNKNDFLLTINLHETEERHSEIKLTFEAEMNPILKMVAAEPVKQFLETLVNEMEKFDGWNDVNEYNQPL